MKSPEDFTNLRKLLALKRYEHPPPGYFDNFTPKVIHRIEIEQFHARRPWWQRWFVTLEIKPVVAAASALVVSSGLLIGISLFQLPSGSFSSSPYGPSPSSPRSVPGLGVPEVPSLYMSEFDRSRPLERENRALSPRRIFENEGGAIRRSPYKARSSPAVYQSNGLRTLMAGGDSMSGD